ncbi:MAG: hypothetical protein F4X82_00085 [Candidatus Spechtbacteria bacterium SB0662_bin_43]|uniref:Uncharacterized protein n=1 Tax=Candidatus Spechtbacteria bacterium SB0662_bin_43 TaxID=2604897 RepID=A0A845DDD8_9BACT|nr:hypothetical protein [Candidatus Spechtbacteria bacterium SB0662_bin_43]
MEILGEELLASIDAFLYSPLMIAVQVFSVILTIGLCVLYWKMLRETGEVSRPVGEVFSSIWLRKSKVARLDYGELSQKWQQVENRMNTHDETQWKMAIIEADTILDEALQQMGVKGKTMGERMKKVNKKKFPMLDSAWRAHRVRNYLVHDPSYHLSLNAAAQTYELYRKVFVDIGVAKDN